MANGKAEFKALGLRLGEGEKTVAVEISPDTQANALHRLARLRFEEQKDDDAIALLRKALKISSPERRALFLKELTGALISAGKSSDALALIGEFVKQNPTEPVYLYFRAEVLAHARREAEVLEQLGAMQSKFPKFAPAFHLAGMVHWKGKRLELAEKKFRQALKLDRRLAGSWQALSEVVHSREGDASMVKIFEQATKALPNDTKLLYLHATSTYAAGDYVRAIGLFERLIRIVGSSPNALSGLAIAQADAATDQPGLNAAKHYANEALKASQSKNALALDAYAWVLIKERKFKKAIELLTKARKIQKDDAAILYHLGRAYLETGNTLKAKALFRQALTVNPPQHYRSEMVKLLSTTN